jgi:hypothetical protein
MGFIQHHPEVELLGPHSWFDFIAGLCIGVSVIAAVELAIMIYMRLRRRSGLYFWSLIVVVGGLVPLNTSLILQLFLYDTHHAAIYIAIMNVGTVCVMNGYVVLLYSRLNLVSSGRRRRRLLVAIMLFSFIFGSLPIMALGFVYNAFPTDPRVAILVKVFYRVQFSTFFLQGVMFSAIYITAVANMIRAMKQRKGSVTIEDQDRRQHEARLVLKQTILINIVTILLEAANLVVAISAHMYGGIFLQVGVQN